MALPSRDTLAALKMDLQATPSPTLLTLPAELLNRILEFCLPKDELIPINLSLLSIDISTESNPSSVNFNWDLTSLSPPLSLVHPTLHKPVMSTYLHQNTFVWHSESDSYEASGRDQPLSQIRFLQSYLGDNGRHIRRFNFAMNYIYYPSFRRGQTGGIQRKKYEVRVRMLQDGEVVGERYDLGASRGMKVQGWREGYAERCCGCDLRDVKVDEKNEDGGLLGWVEEYMRRERRYAVEVKGCWGCGLGRIEEANFEDDG